MRSTEMHPNKQVPTVRVERREMDHLEQAALEMIDRRAEFFKHKEYLLNNPREYSDSDTLSAASLAGNPYRENPGVRPGSSSQERTPNKLQKNPDSQKRSSWPGSR